MHELSFQTQVALEERRSTELSCQKFSSPEVGNVVEYFVTPSMLKGKYWIVDT
jgi:hypothetical protein